MLYQNLKIGDAVPLDGRRGILGKPLDAPRWHALRVAPMKEKTARGIFRASGVYCFYPTEKREKVRNGRRIEFEHPQVTQIIYAKFRHAPQWDVMKARRIITGVFCVGSTPIDLSRDVIRVVQGLPTRAEEMARAREELMRIHAGDRARVVSGPLADLGLVVNVTRSDEGTGRIWWETMTGMKGQSDWSVLQKLDVA